MIDFFHFFCTIAYYKTFTKVTMNNREFEFEYELDFFIIGLCLLLLLVSPDADPVLFVLDSHMKYTVEVVPLCIHIAWFAIV